MITNDAAQQECGCYKCRMFVYQKDCRCVNSREYICGNHCNSCACRSFCGVYKRYAESKKYRRIM